ncbi:MAG: enoyl-CoA hydratase family protein [Planctomycetota bacterium]
MADHPFGYEVDDAVATLTLDRPDRLNALTFEIYRELADRFHALRFEDEVRAVVITGRGKGFCGGGDVEDIIGRLLERDSRDVLAFTRMTGELIENIRRLDKPVIAAVNGTAAGAGAVIALASDFRIMAERARIHFLFTKVGLTGADMGAAWLLPRIVGLARATEWLMLGDGIDADTALSTGLAHRVVPPVDVLPAARELAARLARGPGLAISMTKRLLNNEAHMDLSSAIEKEAIAQALLLRADDHRIFYEAQKAGKPPEFTGR